MVRKTKSPMKVAVLFLFATFLSYSQNFEGEIIYGVERIASKIDNANANGVNPSRQLINEATERLKEITFSLTFTSESSLFKKTTKLNVDNKELVDKMSEKLAGDGTYYTNKKTNVRILQKEFLGDLFLIESKFNNIDWKITDESKKIGEYTCVKAISVIENNPMYKDDRKLIAWFSLEIPMSFGPKGFGGLSGLILELQDGPMLYFAKSIELSKKSKVRDLKEPLKGIRYTQTEYEKYVLMKIEQFGFSEN